MKSFVIGILVGVLILTGGVYFYFSSGMAPAAAGDPPMPFEKKMASASLDAHIEKANLPPPPIPADEGNFLAGAKVYKDHCAQCHGLPDQPPPAISDKMYPHATLLFKGKGVTDDPAQESYWKATNGIRLTGMPSFKEELSDTQRWQVALLVANADKIPDVAKKELASAPVPPMIGSAPAAPPGSTPAKGR